MIHDVTTDGRTLSTDDLAVATPIPGSDEVRMYVLHTIISSTGKFTDKRGTFPSFGIHNQKTRQGVQRCGRDCQRLADCRAPSSP